MMKYEVPPGFPNPDGSPTRPARQGARLVRWTFDLGGNSSSYTEQALSDPPGEYPRLDERFSMQGHRHGYIMSASINDTVLGGRDARAGIAHIDLKTGNPSRATIAASRSSSSVAPTRARATAGYCR